MARLAAVLALALVAGAAVAEARLALCNSNARPAAPTMVKITRNMITPQGAELTVQWNNPTNENSGCVDFYRVQTLINGKQISKDGVMMSNPLQSPVSLLKKGIPANSMVTFRVYAQNRGTQKKSDTVASNMVRAASAGATTGRRLMA